MDTRRFFLALILSVAVLVIWQMLFPPPEPRRETGPPPQAGVESAPEVGEEIARTPPGEAAATGGAAAVPPEAPAAPAELEPITAAAEERVVVETGRYRAELTNRGAQLLSFELKEHPNAEGGPVDLVRSRRQGPYPFALFGADGAPSALNGALFAVGRAAGPGGGEVVEFSYRGPEGAAVKRFSFDELLFEVDIELPEGGAGISLGPGLRNPSAKEQESRFAVRSAVYLTPEGVEKLDSQKAKGVTLVAGGGIRWVGLQDVYFLTAVVPRTPLAEVAFRPMLADPAAGDEGPGGFRALPPEDQLAEAEEKLSREMEVLIRPAGDHLSAVAYFGAKQYHVLSKLPYGLEKTIDLGIFGILARPLLFGLRWIHERMAVNYGWAIILMTVLIRVLLFPLTHKSVVSMQKMQEINPKMQAVRQKYRTKLKDKQGRPNAEMQRKMNEEIMALYKQEGVSPAGGCLPMLLQIPVLFAFYNLLSTAIELRHAPWLGWIRDLSAPDPYLVLPIVMGASQFVQQRLTPTSADPMQRRIFMLMPIFFTVLFLGFPSGLVLYWLTNNLLGIVQQVIYNRIKERKEEAGKSEAPSAKTKKQKA